MNSLEATPKAFSRRDIRFESGEADCAGWLYTPSGIQRPPVIILGHGLGATRDMRLDAFCERFAAMGFAALAFTYRYFGDSGGEPRQLMSVSRQLEDWDGALTYIKNCDDVDGSRVAIWGSSFGGGHAITIASRHPELKAILSQCPFTDGLASAMALGLQGNLAASPYLLRDLFAKLFNRQPVMVPIAAKPGQLALMNAHDALQGYLALMPAGTEFNNQVAARAMLDILTYRPGRLAAKVKSPILFCVSRTDTVTPPEQTLKYARAAPLAEIKNYDAGHFDFYGGDTFEQLVDDQIKFLTKHLIGPKVRHLHE